MTNKKEKIIREIRSEKEFFDNNPAMFEKSFFHEGKHYNREFKELFKKS